MTDSTDNALKPCPFCGSSEIEDVMRTGYLQCQYCLASAKNRTAWNRRADLAPNSTDNARGSNDWSCAGCGISGPDTDRRCDCATAVVVRGKEGQWKTGPTWEEMRARRADPASDPLGAVKVKPLVWDDSGAAWVAWDDVKEYVVYAENRKEAERIDNERAARIRSALEPCDQLADQIKPLNWVPNGQGFDAAAFGIDVFYRVKGSPGNWSLISPGGMTYVETPGYKTRAAARDAGQVDFARRVVQSLKNGKVSE